MEFLEMICWTIRSMNVSHVNLIRCFPTKKKVFSSVNIFVLNHMQGIAIIMIHMIIAGKIILKKELVTIFLVISSFFVFTIDVVSWYHYYMTKSEVYYAAVL